MKYNPENYRKPEVRGMRCKLMNPITREVVNSWSVRPYFIHPGRWVAMLKQILKNGTEGRRRWR